MVGARGPLYYLLGNVITATVDLVYINLQPDYVIPPLVLDNFESLEKLDLGDRLPQPPPKNLSARGLCSCSWLPARHI